MGEETHYESDLPACCRRNARGYDDSFVCPACGASWQAPLGTEPEECALTERAGDGERKGAA